MSNASGPIKKIIYDNQSINLTADVETNFYPGGWTNTEGQTNIGGSNPKTEYVHGRMSGITSRTALNGSLKLLLDLLKKTAHGEVVSVIFELPSGEKYSGPVYAVWDADSFYSNSEGKTTFELHASEGEFSPVS